MNEHASQLKYYAVKSHGTYDNSKFGLYFTTVGEDVEKNDFLEHIDPDASARYLEEHAEEIEARKAAAAAEEAEPEPEPEAEAEPEPEPEPEDEPEPGAEPEAESEPTAEPAAASPTAAPTPRPVAEGEPLVPTGAAPTTAKEKGGSAALPIAMIGLGVAAIGAGGWYGWRFMASKGRRRRRRR